MEDKPKPKPNPITEDDVRHAAKLSRLALDDEQVAHFTEQLDAVLGYIAKLNELDVEDVEPMAHPMAVTNVLRKDEAESLYTAERMLASAPDAEPPYFKVTKVIDDGSGA